MRFLFFIFFSLSSVLAQQVSIKEVLDANLFKLSDGRIIKLAGVDAPSDSSSIPFLRSISESAKENAKSYINVKLMMDSISHVNRDGYSLVLLYKKFPLQKLYLNEQYLSLGYGKFINNLQGLDSTELKKADSDAKESEKGIWTFFTPTNEDTLDIALTKSGIVSILSPDTLKMTNSYNRTPVVYKILFELLAGGGVTFISTFSGAAVLSGAGPWAALGGAVVGFGVGYLIGFPTMVYLIAKEENPNLNPWINFACSWGLTLVTGVTAVLIKEDHHPINYIAAISPIIGSLVYAHILAPQSPAYDNTFLLPDKKISSFKDFRESQTTRLELFRINF